MPSLLVLGNKNQFTFGNAILAASQMAKVRYGHGLSRILVLHSPESHRELVVSEDWRREIERRGIDRHLFTEHEVEMTKPDAIRVAARHIEQCFRVTGTTEDPVYVDLTNGSSLYKNVSSTLAYLLGAQHPFVLIPENIRSGSSGNVRARFWSPDEIAAAYLELPPPDELDELAPSWLTEIRRFRTLIREESKKLTDGLGAEAFDGDHFTHEVHHAIGAWMEGQRTLDPAALRSSVRSIGSALEEVVRAVLRQAGLEPSSGNLNLHRGIAQIHSHLTMAAADYEPSLLHSLAELLRTLRNVSTHERTSAKFEKIRARLATELLLAITDHVANLTEEGVIQSTSGSASRQGETSAREIKVGTTGTPGEQYYFGIDGDNTGLELERLFLENAEDQYFTNMSTPVDNAIREIKKRVPKAPINGKVLFCSGDDILFRGSYSPDAIDELRELYAEVSGGLTCSIGFGSNVKAAYIALKIAKAHPGKNTIQGVVLNRSPDS